MFMVRPIAWLVSLPVLWAGQLAALLKQPAAASLLEAAWRIGGDGDVANAALANRKQLEPAEAILARALQWLDRRPCPQIAAYAGLLAMGAGNVDLARQLLARGRELGEEPKGSLDLLEICVVMRSDDKDAVDELIGRWASRRDLSPEVSEFVLAARLELAMSRRDWPEVERRARHLWSIKNHPNAAAALWALDRLQGRNRDLGADLDKTGVSHAGKLLLQAEAFNAVGATGEAEESVRMLEQVDPVLGEWTRKFIEQQEKTA